MSEEETNKILAKPCEECGKEQRLYNCKGRRICGACKGRYYKKNALRVITPDAKPSAGRAEYKLGATEVRVPLIFVGNGTDKDIYEYLQSEALRCRRSIEQQAMWILQAAYENADRVIKIKEENK